MSETNSFSATRAKNICGNFSETTAFERYNFTIYCMKPPNIKAPKCTLFSIQCFIFQGQRSQALTGLATAHCEHRWGQLTLESQYRIVESG